MSQMPAKIVLKSTTAKTLNDRFTEMARAQVRSPPQVTITGVRSNQFQMSQTSVKNRRLAAQMANRIGVQAALGVPSNQQSNLKNRLGSPNRGRGRGVSPGVRRGQLKNRLGIAAVGRSRGGRGGARGQGVVGRGFKQGQGQGSNMRGVGVGRRGGGAIGRSGRGARGVVRGGRGGRGTTRGRGRGRGEKPVSKDKLDAELDKYMSKTKSHLDAELDDYMQHADADNE